MYQCKYCLELFECRQALGGHTTKCQKTKSWDDVVRNIERGDATFYVGVLKKYLIHKFGEKCMECGWAERNFLSGRIPIEIDHIDGNSENNNLKNLRLLCPNHQSLTPTYKSLNKGNGRWKRQQRYHAGKSY